MKISNYPIRFLALFFLLCFMTFISELNAQETIGFKITGFTDTQTAPDRLMVYLKGYDAENALETDTISLASSRINFSHDGNGYLAKFDVTFGRNITYVAVYGFYDGRSPTADHDQPDVKRIIQYRVFNIRDSETENIISSNLIPRNLGSSDASRKLGNSTALLNDLGRDAQLVHVANFYNFIHTLQFNDKRNQNILREELSKYFNEWLSNSDNVDYALKYLNQSDVGLSVAQKISALSTFLYKKSQDGNGINLKEFASIGEWLVSLGNDLYTAESLRNLPFFLTTFSKSKGSGAACETAYDYFFSKFPDKYVCPDTPDVFSKIINIQENFLSCISGSYNRDAPIGLVNFGKAYKQNKTFRDSMGYYIASINKMSKSPACVQDYGTMAGSNACNMDVHKFYTYFQKIQSGINFGQARLTDCRIPNRGG